MEENRMSRNRLMRIIRIDFPQSCQEKSRGGGEFFQQALEQLDIHIKKELCSLTRSYNGYSSIFTR